MPDLGFDRLAVDIHANAREKGFWTHRTLVARDPVTGDVESRPVNPSIDAEKIALMHSELSEALEAHRDGDMDHVEEELADVIIRVLDFAEAHGMSMNKAVPAKMEKNRTREALHGREW